MRINKDKIFQEHLTKHSKALLDIFFFEAKSFVGGIIQNRKPPLQRGIRLLNLGSGTTSYFKGWVNSDFYNGFLPWNRTKVKHIWKQDFRKGLNCPNDYWDGVFTEHTLEHLYPDEVLFLLKDVYRTLKNNAWIRISVPDLNKYIKFYFGNKDQNFSNNWQTGAAAIQSLTQNFQHHSIWDFELLRLYLQRAGFRKIRKVSYLKGTDKKIIKDNKNRKWESLYVEAQKLS